MFDLIDYNVVDALIVYSETFYDKGLLRAVIAKADENKKPVIVIGENDPEHISLILDYIGGFEQVVRHVVEYHNKHDVHLIAGQKGEEHSEGRIAAFKKVLAENGIEFSDDMLSYGDYWHIPTCNAVNSLLKRDKLPEAVICANDSMAITACQEFEKNGVAVPGEALVTGFDGIKEVEYCEPTVTISKYDLIQFAEKITVLAGRALDGENVAGVHYMDFSLVIHSSCGCRDEYKRRNLVGILKNTENSFNGYHENERTLHETLENSIMCDTPEEITQQFKNFPFGNVYVAINKSCFNSSVNPLNENSSKSFDDRFFLAYPLVEGAQVMPEGYDKSSLMTLLSGNMNNDMSIVITALGFMECRLDSLFQTLKLRLSNTVNYRSMQIR